MEHCPQTCVVVCRQHHALADDRLTLYLVVVVVHDVEHTVEEYVCRLDEIDSLQYLAPSLLGCLCVAEPEDIELLAGLGVINPSHRTHTVLDGYGVILALLCVDIQQHIRDHLLFYLVGLGIPHLVGHLAPQSVAMLTAQRCRHQLRHKSRLTIARLAADDVQLTDICEGYTVALHRVSRRAVGLLEVEEITINLFLKPVVAL